MPSVFGTLLDGERAVVGEDRLLVEGGAGQGARVRSGGDDDVLRGQRLRLAPATAISQPPSPFFTNEPRPWKNWTLFFLKR
jgi:hypothetical protein